MDAGRRGFLGLKPTARETLRKRYFPDVALQTHRGNAVRFYDDVVKDKVVLINFMYLNCEETCPITTHNLMMVQSRLGRRVGRDIFMYSITLDPERDTIAELAKNVRSHGIRPGWEFLRASVADTELLRRKLGFVSSNPAVDANKSAHAAMVRYGNEPRQLWAGVSAFAAPQAIVRYVLSVT